MTLLKDNNYKEINVALLSLEADIKNKITGSFDTSEIDKQLAEINSRIDKINAGGGSSSSEEIEDINSKLNSNSIKIRNIEQNVEDIGTQIDGIEQKLSDIFSAENKVTDFNTTTNSGIYYWVNDAANRPTDYGVLLVNKYDGVDSANNLWINQIAYGTNGKIYFRQNINSGNWTEWKAVAFDGEVKSNFLDEYVGAGGTRLTSGNIVPKDATEYGGMRKDVVTDLMTDSGRPGVDGHLLTMFWDNAGRYDTQLFISNNDPLTLKARIKANGTDYGPWVDVITGNNAGSKLILQGGTVSSNSYTDTNPKLEFKNNDGSQNISLTFTDFDAVQAPASLTLNGNQGNEYFIAPNIKATGNFYGNLSGKASTAGTADRARNMYYQNLDLSALDKTKFYPLVCHSGTDFAEVAICSESGMGSMEYNQNRIHFDISTQGWSDLPPTLNIREYACYQNNEVTIGCIGRGNHNGAWAIWLRGGLHYTCFSRNADLSLHTSDYTFGDETYTVGTNYYGGSNTNVSIMFTPQSTITNGAYSSRDVTATEIKANNRMIIPIGAPSSLVDGCIWIER